MAGVDDDTDVAVEQQDAPVQQAADTTDPRFGNPVWAGESSPWPGVTGWNTILGNLHSKAAIGRHGLTSAMGAPTVADQFYYATDTNKLWASADGSAWVEVSPLHIRHGTDAAKGAAANPDQLYWATDTAKLYASGAGTGLWGVVTPPPFTFSEMTTTRTVNLSIPTGVWTPVGWSNSSDTRGSEFGSSPSGLVVTTGGRYLCNAFASIQGGAGTRRGITVGTVEGGVPALNTIQPPVGPTVQNNLAFTRVINVAKGQTITMYCYQDSGAALLGIAPYLTLNAIWLP